MLLSKAAFIFSREQEQLSRWWAPPVLGGTSTRNQSVKEAQPSWHTWGCVTHTKAVNKANQWYMREPRDIGKKWGNEIWIGNDNETSQSQPNWSSGGSAPARREAASLSSNTSCRAAFWLQRLKSSCWKKSLPRRQVKLWAEPSSANTTLVHSGIMSPSR